MIKFCIVLYNILSLYLYYLLGAAALYYIPQVNPDYPMFRYIFKYAGFNLVPEVFGFNISPVVMIVGMVLFLALYRHVYFKYILRPRIFYVPDEELYEQICSEQQMIETLNYCKKHGIKLDPSNFDIRDYGNDDIYSEEDYRQMMKEFNGEDYDEGYDFFAGKDYKNRFKRKEDNNNDNDDDNSDEDN